ncbi:unnamed protein product [Coregonus sp. 'balchen']|nr:unnamed protein product [Coregonus sp. 'balchen']
MSIKYPLSSHGPSAGSFLSVLCLLAASILPGAQASYLESSECVSGKGKGCLDLSEKKSDLRVCDAATCRYGGTCQENGADLKCVCQFHVSNTVEYRLSCSLLSNKTAITIAMSMRASRNGFAKANQLLNVCSSVLELFLSINVLYYVSFHVLCGPQEE